MNEVAIVVKILGQQLPIQLWVTEALKLDATRYILQIVKNG